MNLLTEILVHIIQSIGGLYIVAVILRFLLQLVRADFYNPISQALVKITNPALIPIRRVIPGVYGVDIASIVLALLLQLVIGELIFFIVYQQFYNPISAITFGVLGTLNLAIYVIFAAGFIIFITSFLSPHSAHPIIILSRQLLDPMMRPIQRLIPPMGGLDLSLFFLILGVGILQRILEHTAFALKITYTGLTYLVIGF